MKGLSLNLSRCLHLSATLCDGLPPIASDSEVSIRTASVIFFFLEHTGTLAQFIYEEQINWTTRTALNFIIY